MLDSLRDIEIVGDVRGAGYFHAIELVKDRDTKATLQPTQEAETLLRGFLSRGDVPARARSAAPTTAATPWSSSRRRSSPAPSSSRRSRRVLRPVLEEAVAAGCCTARDRPAGADRPRGPRRPRRRGSWPARPASTCRSAGCTSPSWPTRRRGCRAASCCSRPAWRSTTPPSASATFMTPPGRPRPGRARRGDGLRARRGARRRSCEAADERDFPLFEVPYELPFIADHRAGLHAPGQRAVRAAAALDRRAGAPAAHRPLRARPGGDRRRARRRSIGGAALVFDGRGELQAQRTFRRELDPEVVAALGEELRERARRGDSARLRARRPRAGPARAGAAESAAASAGTARRRRAAAGLARGGQGRRRPGGDRPPHPAPGRDRRRARAAAPARRRHRPSAGWPATCSRAVIAGELEGRRPRAAPGALRARRARDGARAGPARRAQDADGLRGRPGRGAARRGRQRAGRAARAATSCALLPGLPRGRAVRARRARPSPARRGGARRAPARGRGARRAGRARARGLPRGALRAGGARARGRGPPRRQRQRRTAAPRGVATYRDLGSFQLLLSLQDTDALRLFCESLLGPIENGEGHYGGELDALARGLHRVQRAVGGGGPAPVLPPPHPALPHPQDRGADGPRPGLRARPHRVLAGPARPRDRHADPRPTARSTSEGRRPHRDQDGRVPRRADARRACASWPTAATRCRAGRRRRGLGDHRRRLRRPGRADRPRRRGGLRARPT